MLKAIEDYLRGPEFLCNVDGEKLFNENKKYNEKLINIANISKAFKLYDTEIENAEFDFGRKFLSKLIYHLTDNGHKYVIAAHRKKGLPTISANNVRITEKITLYPECLAVNIEAGTAAYRQIDKEKYKSIKKDAQRIKKLYKKNSRRVNQQYLDSKEYMTSEAFWVSKWKEY
jgi:hypothetical protein